MRCTNCYEVWFQLPDPEELRARTEEQSWEGGDDIPEAVKPQSRNSLPAIKDDDEEDGKQLTRRKVILQSLFVFLVLFAASAGGLFYTKDQLVSIWPQSAALYTLVGIEAKLPGEGLVFDRLEARATPDGVRVSGSIINLSRVSVGVPIIEVQFRASGQSVLGAAYIQAPLPRVESEGVLPFEALLPDHHGASDVLARFTLGARSGNVESARTDAEDDGNIPAPPASEIDPLSAPAESGEFLPPASAEPHPE